MGASKAEGQTAQVLRQVPTERSEVSEYNLYAVTQVHYVRGINKVDAWERWEEREVEMSDIISFEEVQKWPDIS